MTSDHDLDPPVAASTNSKKTTKRLGRRARVTRACDRCKKRKIKCNGRRPCDFCIQAKAHCSFDVAYNRGRLPPIPSSLEPSADNDASTEDNLAVIENVLLPSEHQTSMMVITDETEFFSSPGDHAVTAYNSAPPAIGQHTNVATTTPGQTEASRGDLQGHYIGPSSGLSFLLRVQKRLDQAISFSHPNSIFAFGDAPLQSLDTESSFCMVLPRHDAQRLVDRYFDFAMPTYRFLHRPSIEAWVNEFYDTFGSMHGPQSSSSTIALIFMVFAHGLVYMPDNERPGPPELSARYHHAAEHQLTKEKGAVRLCSIQARLLQCCYLLTQSRINHCWSLFGTVSRLAIGMGLNRNWRPDMIGEAGQIQLECWRRTFWCAYTLDMYLSVALGRARAFHDEDIDTEYPKLVEDHELTTNNAHPSYLEDNFSTMFASVAHFRLARIISTILRDLYAIKPLSTDRRVMLTERASKALSDWRAELTHFLDGSSFTSPEHPIFQRQRNVLNLTYWHAVILTHRPTILHNLIRSSQRRTIEQEDNANMEESFQQCLMAARNTVDTINAMSEISQMFGVFWITTYFAFTASIVLFICVIKKQDLTSSVASKYFTGATRCQAQISGIAEAGSLSERYCLLLEELRIEALRRLEVLRSTEAGADGANLFPFMDESQNIQPRRDSQYTGGIHDYQAEIDQQNLVNDVSGTGFFNQQDWEQFASMVSSGLGNLDTFLRDDHFKF